MSKKTTKEQKINIYIGLLKKDMKTKIKNKKVLNCVLNQFKEIGIDGFNVIKTIGYYKGQQEPSLKFSFINIFKIKTETILKILEKLKKELEQESILIEKEQIFYEFV